MENITLGAPLAANLASDGWVPTEGWVARTPEEVTPAWLTSVLREAGRLQSASVTDVRHERVGHGLMSDAFRYELSFDAEEADAPATLVAKLAAADETARASGVRESVYLREVRFYQQIVATVDMYTARAN